MNSFNRSLNITPQSDYSSLELNCIVDNYVTYPCSNLTEPTYSCYPTQLYLYSPLGCDYNCSFITKKTNYIDKHSNQFKITFRKCLVILILKLSKEKS